MPISLCQASRTKGKFAKGPEEAGKAEEEGDNSALFARWIEQQRIIVPCYNSFCSRLGLTALTFASLPKHAHSVLPAFNLSCGWHTSGGSHMYVR